jgi:hypothetical protein
MVNPPQEQNPMFDPSGSNCNVNQNGPVWFMAGTMNGAELERQCTVKYGSSILIVVLGGISSERDRCSIPLIECVRSTNDHGLFSASINNQPISNLSKYRVTTPQFDFTFAENNVFGISPGTVKAVADGWYIFLKPLPPGTYDVRYEGQNGDPTDPFASDVRVKIKIE